MLVGYKLGVDQKSEGMAGLHGRDRVELNCLINFAY
jgi:hypothetical protein